MGEGPKDLRPTGAAPTGSTADAQSGDTAVLRAEIERKRTDISDTLDEIQGRLTPRRLVSEARDRVRDKAGTAASHVANTTRQAASRTVEQAREHPWSAAAAAAGLGAAAWWLARRSHEDEEFWEPVDQPAPAEQIDISEESLYRDFGDDFAFVDDEDRLTPMLKTGAVPVVLSGLALGWWLWSRRSGGETSLTGEDASWNGGAYGSAGADAGSYRTFDERRWQEDGSREGAVRRAMSGVASRARHAAAAAGERTRGVAGRAQRQLTERSRTAGDRLSRWVDRNPLGAGAIALVAGLLVGLAVPESEREHRTLGAARDRLIENARRAGRDAVSRARDTVVEAAAGRRSV